MTIFVVLYKGVILIFENKLLQELYQLQNHLSQLKVQINNLPDGNILCTHNGNKTKWYLSNGKKPIYLPKSKRPLAEQLAYKKYLLTLQRELSAQEKILASCLKQYSSIPIKSTSLLSTSSAYHDLLSAYFNPDSQELATWSNSSFETNPKHPEQLIHKTSSGHFVRSKSEELIDTLLYVNKIPFRYEAVLQLDTLSFYPDFTIRHPKTGDTFYWEHFGLMDNPSYYRKAFSKLHTYASYGIIPSINLITTYETQTHPLNSDSVNKLIHEYFL